ncbi:MAG: lipid A deacylase LpxR family protein [Leptospiraceae bacterium]|nr:lipid A deacylase LpxR family protein [Leptospiraceae bacterium]
MKYLVFIVILFNSLNAQTIARFQLENDFYSDKYYTNGIKVDVHNNELISPSKYLLKKFYGVFWDLNCGKECFKETTGYSIAQTMFTPLSLTSYSFDYNDRPYAGVMSLGNSYTIARGGFMHHTEIRTGVIGSDSRAEETQKWIHSTFGFPRPNGWDHQIQGGGFGNIMHRTYYGFNNNLGMTLDASVGNLDTSGALGLLFRRGDIQSRNSFTGIGVVQAVSPPLVTREEGDEEEFYYYFLPSVKYQAHDGTLQGVGTKSKEPSSLGSVLFPRNLQEVSLEYEVARFLYFNSLYDPLGVGDLIQNHLVFSSAFNNGRYIGLKDYTNIYYLLVPEFNNLNLEKKYLLLSNLKLIEPNFDLMRFVATNNVLNELELSNPGIKNPILAYLFINRAFDRTAEHRVVPKNVQGKIELGSVYNSERYALGVSLTLATLEFQQDIRLENYHYWFSFLAARKF